MLAGNDPGQRTLASRAAAAPPDYHQRVLDLRFGSPLTTNQTLRPVLFNISGPYGAGKDTLLNAMLERYASRVHRVGTITTRPVDRKTDPSYEHLEPAAFDERILSGRWLVNRQLGGETRYGTSLDEIEEAAQTGKLSLHSIYPGPDGAGALRSALGSRLFSVAVLPSAGPIEDQLRMLRSRLERRNRDDRRALDARLADQRRTIKYVLDNPVVTGPDGTVSAVFDRTMVNESLPSAVDLVASFVESLLRR